MFKEGYYEEIGINLFYQFEDYRKKYVSLATVEQISFLLGLISNHKFKNGRKIEKVLEIGVYNGVTSLYMLKAGCQSCTTYKQYGIDFERTDFYGEAVLKEASEEELESFHLNKEKTAINIPEIINDNEKLDLIFIDAGHTHPNPLIDLVSVIPYLHEESIVCLHDVVNYMRPNAWGESFIYEIWPDKKYRNINQKGQYETLGVIKIPTDKKVLYKTLIDLAKIPFRAAPWKYGDKYMGVDEKVISCLKRNMLKHYDPNFVEEFIGYFEKNLKIYNEEYVLRIHETRFYNYLFEQIGDLKRKVTSLQYENKLLIADKNILKILNSNKNKKILFWGASLYLQDFLKFTNLSDYNILGIVDINAQSNTMMNNYKFYLPSEIKDLDADLIIPTVLNSHKKVYNHIEEFLLKNKINIELAPNIFIS